MVAALGPIPSADEKNHVRQNVGIQQLYRALNGFPPLIIGGCRSLVDLNSANTDYPITIASPSPFYYMQGVLIKNNGTTASLTTATAGLFTAAAAAGTALVANQILSDITSSTVNTQGNMKYLTLGASSRQWQNNATLYFRVGTAQGAAATADVYIFIQPLP